MEEERTEEEVKKIDETISKSLDELMKKVKKIEKKYVLSPIEVAGLLEQAKFLYLLRRLMRAMRNE
jgi:hypothetical protein